MTDIVTDNKYTCHPTWNHLVGGVQFHHWKFRKRGQTYTKYNLDPAETFSFILMEAHQNKYYILYF